MQSYLNQDTISAADLPIGLVDSGSSVRSRLLLTRLSVLMAQMPIAILSIGDLAVILVSAKRRRHWDDRLFLSAFVLLALIGNAFICGALSSPHNRYQSRLIWQACFAVFCS
jgi:hypothetical protein